MNGKMQRARVPLTVAALLVAGAILYMMLPRSGGGDASIAQGDTGVMDTMPVITTPAEDTAAAGGTTDPDPAVPTTVFIPVTTIPAPVTGPVEPPIGGVRPAWPEWVAASNEAPAASSYSATLTLQGRSVEDLIVWLSMQNWTLSAETPDSPEWELSAGEDGAFTGALRVEGPNTVTVTLRG